MKHILTTTLFLLPLLACASPDKGLTDEDTNVGTPLPPTGNSTATTATGSNSGTSQTTGNGTSGAVTIDPGLEDQLNGQIASGDYPPPTFVATNYDGGERTEANLVGHPTVLWFYPLAKTPG